MDMECISSLNKDSYILSNWEDEIYLPNKIFYAAKTAEYTCLLIQVYVYFTSPQTICLIVLCYEIMILSLRSSIPSSKVSFIVCLSFLRCTVKQ